jgi:hypothetical protein
MQYKATQLHSTQAQTIHSSSTCLWLVRRHLCWFSVSINYSVIWRTQYPKYISGKKVRWIQWGHSIIQTSRRKAVNRKFHHLNVKLWKRTGNHNKYSIDIGTIYEHYLQVRIEIVYIIGNQPLYIAYFFFREISYRDKRHFWPFLCMASPLSSLSYTLIFNRLWFWTHIYNTVQHLFIARLLQ